MYYWNKNGLADQRLKFESPESIIPQKYEQIIYNKVAKSIN